MKILFLLLLLSGCAVQKFDSDEYKRIVTAETLLSPKMCSDIKTVKTTLNNFSDQLDYIRVYESGLQNNDSTTTMLNGVVDEATRFQNLANTSDISYTYCSNKIASIRHTMGLLLKAEGAKQ